jgi:cell division protein FtsW
MTILELISWLVVGGAAWYAAGRVALGRAASAAAAVWVAPMLGGAIGLAALASLDTEVPAFADVAPRAAVFWVLAAAAFAFASQIGTGLLQTMRLPLALGGLVIQASAFLLGSSAASRITLEIPGLGSFVTSELARVCLVAATGGVVVRVGPALNEPLTSRVLRPLLGIGACWLASAAISLAARDTGAATLTVAVLAVSTLFVLGRPGPTLAITAAGGIGVGVAAAAFPHAVGRIADFLSPPDGELVEQARMAMFASSSGRMVGHADGGVGLEHVGSTLDDDFLLAAVGRVLGLSGMVAVVVLVTVAALASLRAAEGEQPSSAQGWIAYAAAALLGTQLLLAAGGVFGVVPATGVPVPFMTGSGASLLATGALMGLVAAAIGRVAVPRPPTRTPVAPTPVAATALEDIT